MRLKFSIFALAIGALTGCPASKEGEKKTAPSAEPAKAAAAPATPAATAAASAKPSAKAKEDDDKGGW